jgi:hypothetical protein
MKKGNLKSTVFFYTIFDNIILVNEIRKNNNEENKAKNKKIGFQKSENKKKLFSKKKSF